MISSSQRGTVRRGVRICRLLMLAAALWLGCRASENERAPDATASLRSPSAGGANAAPHPDPQAGSFAARPAVDARIVSLSPLATRFLVELGVGARIVAVDPASTALPGFEDEPTTSLPDAARFAPDFVIVPALPSDAAAVSGLDPRTSRIVELAPHDLEDVTALCRSLGVTLVGEEEALQLERRILRPLSLVAGQSPPDGRPGVVAIVATSPLVIAGGHSFETDLIEIAGGTSLTHGGDEPRRSLGREALARLDPDLILVTSTPEPDPVEQERIALELGELAPVVFFPFESEGFWLDEPERVAARLRDLIAEFRPQSPPVAESSSSSAR